MKKSYQIAIVLLSAALVFTWASGPPAFGQRFRVNSGNSNQNDNKKDKDKDDQNNSNNNSGNNSNNQNSSNNQGNKGGNQNNSNNNNQGNNQNNANSSNSGNSNKSSNSSTEDKIKQFLQNKNQGQGGNQGQFFQNQGNSNNRNFGNRNNSNNNNNDNNFNNSGFKVNPGNAQPRNKFDDDDWDHNKNRITIGTWNGSQWQGSRKVDNWNKAFGNNQKLFSKQWYDDHPHAWRWDNNNHKSDVWVVASVPGVYQWLGWGAVPQEYRTYYNPGNVPQFDPNDYGDWYPIGVYSMMTGPDDVGTRVVQLALDRRGRISGTYYDMITDNSFQVSGDMQQQTQRAQWWVNSNPNVRFSASLFRLLQPDGSITVQLPGGQQRWQFVRMEN